MIILEFRKPAVPSKQILHYDFNAWTVRAAAARTAAEPKDFRRSRLGFLHRIARINRSEKGLSSSR